LSEEPKGLFIALGLEPQEALAAAARQERRSTLLILGSLLLALTLALAGFGLLIERPVRRMLAVAGRWGQEDWTARLGRIGGGSEFGRLATAFDAMAGEVQRREAARAESENRLRALLDISPQVVFTANSRGAVTWMNRWWWNYTGTAPEAPDRRGLAARAAPGGRRLAHPRLAGSAAAPGRRARAATTSPSCASGAPPTASTAGTPAAPRRCATPTAR
jgi:PAS domain-containing protein